MLVDQIISLKAHTNGTCNFCGVSVHIHHQSLDPSSSTPPLVSSSSSNIKTKLDKNIIYQLPKWKTQYKLCTPFFNTLEMLFSVHDVTDESLFKKYLQLSLSDLPDFEKLYAHTHITSDSSLSWSLVKLLFSQRFESYDHINQLKRQYQRLKYNIHDDNIQSFSHRFINLCTQLSYDINSSPIIDNFLFLLPSDMHRRFSMQCQYRQTSLSSYTKLDAIINDITLLENSYNNVQHFSSPHHNNNYNNISTNNNNNYNNNHDHNDHITTYSSSKHVTFQGSSNDGSYPSSSPSSLSPVKLQCINHPHSTSHTTAECRYTTSQSSSFVPSSTPSLKFQPSNLSSPGKTQPICHSCGQPGHYSPQCPNKLSSRAPTASSSGSSQPFIPPPMTRSGYIANNIQPTPSTIKSFHTTSPSDIHFINPIRFS